MDKRFIIKLSFKNLWSRKARATLTLLGIAISFAAIVLLMSLAFGIERLVTNEVTKGNAFVDIDVGTGNSQVITLTDTTLANIKNISGVKSVYDTVSIGAESTVKDRSMDVSFSGTSQGYLDKTGVSIQKGRGLTGESDELVVNTAFLKFWSPKSDAVLGKKATFAIVVPQDLTGADQNVVVPGQVYHIVGIIKDDASPKVYTDFNNLRKYHIATYNQFKVEVSSRSQVAGVRTKIEDMGLKTQYVGDTVDQINQVFNIVRAILAVFGSIALVVALLGMFNMLTLSLLERIKEIAMMKMLGIRQRDLSAIFLTESIILGVSGGLLGLLFGTLAGEAVNLALNHFAIKMGGSATSIFYTPGSFMLVILVVSLGVGLLTGIYPARKAIKIKSLDALRYE